MPQPTQTTQVVKTKSNMPALCKLEIEDLFEEVRKEFYFPPAKLEFHDDPDSPFYMHNNRICIYQPKCINRSQTVSIIRHEIGHMEYAPITIMQHGEFIEVISHILQINDIQFLGFFSNVIYDMLVDYNILWDFNDDLHYRIETSIKSMNLTPQQIKQQKDNYLWVCLMAFYSSICNHEFISGIDPKIQAKADKAVKIVSDNTSLHDKIKNLTKLFKKLAEEQNDKDMKKMRQIMGQIKKLLNQNSNGQITTRESMGGEQDKRDSLIKGMNGDSQSDNNSVKSKGMASASGVAIEGFYWMVAKARKNIKFRIALPGGKGGKSSRGALLIWKPHEPIEKLDVAQSIINHGVLIPGLTTMKFESKKSTNQYECGIPAFYIVVDTSGSMRSQDTTIALYSFIEAAKSYGVPVSVTMFCTTMYFTKPKTTNYFKLQRDIFENFSSGGTTLYSGIEGLLTHNPKNSVIIYITDWESDANDQNQTDAKLQQLAQRNAILNIEMFGGDEYKGSLRTIRARDEKALGNLLIDFVSNEIKIHD